MEVTKHEKSGVIYYAWDEMTAAGGLHGFSTRVGGVSQPPLDTLNLGANQGDDPEAVEENFRRFCGAIGADPDRLVKNHQVHGDLVRAVTEGDIMPRPGAPGVFEADGLSTDRPGLALTIFSADCTPVLLFDPVRKAAAAVHSGWRGTAIGAAARGVECLVRRYGSRPENILAAIGPCISACCFETHGDVPDGLRAGMGEEAEQFIRPLLGGEKYMVDLKGANRRWLERAGVEEKHIAVCPACTACDPVLFWSHRRMGSRRGSMAAVLQIRSEKMNEKTRRNY